MLSYSRVTGLMNCSKKFIELGYESSDAMQLGLELHHHLEMYLKHGVKDDFELSELGHSEFKEVLNIFDLDKTDKIKSELVLNNGEFKGIIDIAIFSESKKQILVCDLKTINGKYMNKYNPHSSEQLILYSRILKHHYPDYQIARAFILYDKFQKKVTISEIVLYSNRCEEIYQEFRNKAKVARFIQYNNLKFSHKNEFCGFCSLQKNCERRY